jgi:uncharacterized membrane protein YgcG
MMQPSSAPRLRVAVPSPRRRRNESGFALLLVFLMAAILALSLYMEIPRVAFDTERQKEELLVERGEQYKRALQVYVRALNHYPAKIEDLEDTNNRHFLRRRYIDPMTGKDEWRLIHMQNGILTDSKVQTQQQKDQQQKDSATAIGQTVGQVAGLGLDANNQNQASAANLANRRRASDSAPQPGMDTGTGTADPNNPGVTTPGMPPGSAPQLPGSTTTANGQPGMPGMPGVPGVPSVPGVPGIPGLPGTSGVGQPGQPYPTQLGTTGVPGMPGSTGTTGGSTGSGSGSGYLGGGGSYLGGGGSYLGGSSSSSSGSNGGTQPGYAPGMPAGSQTGGLNPAAGYQQPGMTTPGFMPPGTVSGLQQPQTAAPQNLAGMLGLTGPRPGGMPGTSTNGMATLGGGIAGFASKGDADSIMVYNQQKNYGLWEFVFDPTKVPPLPNPVTGTVGSPAGSQIGTPATQVGTPAGQMNNGSGFGNSTSGFGNSNNGFGNSPGGFGNSQGGFGSNPSAPGGTPGGGMGLPPPSQPPPPPY